MARLASARRDAGIENAEQDAPARRVTRSQSVEPKDPVHASHQARLRSGRTVADTQTTQDINELEDDADAVADLTAIQEDEEHVISESIENDEDDDLEYSFPPVSSMRESVASGFSGTTAKTSFSQEEIQELDPDLMIDVLPNLVSASQELRKAIAPSEPDPSPEVWKEIRHTGSRLNKLYQNRLSLVELHKPKYGSEAYIQPRNVNRALLGVQAMKEVPTAVWRPDNLLYLCNIVQMLNSLLVTCDPNDWTSTAIVELERLDVAFPPAIAGPQFDMTNVEFYVDIAAQLAIARLEVCLKSEPDASPFEVIHKTLYDDNESIKYTLALGLLELGDEARNDVSVMISNLDEALRQPFTAADYTDSAVAISMLKSKFPWTGFIDRALRYSTYRTGVLNDLINAAGGVERIVDGLARELQRRDAVRASGQTVEKYEKRQSIPATGKLKVAWKEILQEPQSTDIVVPVEAVTVHEAEEHNAPLQPNSAPPMVIPQAKMTIEDDEYMVLGDDVDYEDGQLPLNGSEPVVADNAPSSLPVFSALHASQKQIKDAIKPKSLLDKQQGAVRLEWNETQPSQDLSSQPIQQQPARGVKRSRPSEDEAEEGTEIFEPTQDEGFQSDTRNTAAADQRRKEVSYEPISSIPHRPSFNESSVPDHSTEEVAVAQHVMAERSPKRRRKNPGSAIPPPVEADAPPSTAYQRVKQIAQRNRAMNSQSKPPQERTMWSDAEEDTLIILIEENCHGGISWAALKAIDQENGNLLKDRDAESMRQKARNMKTTMLLAGSSLPTNWEKVVLDKKLIDKLHARNIPYTQERVRNSRKN